MIFRHLQVFRLPAPWHITADSLRAQLEKKPLQRCGSQDTSTVGWVSPTGDDAVLLHDVGGQWLIALGIESRVLPAAAVNQEADQRIAAVSKACGYAIGRKQRQEIKAEVIRELLPRALTTRSRLLAWIDPVNGWLVVNASSRNQAEAVTERLRQTLDTFPVSVWRTERSPTSAMAEWLDNGEAPDGFTIDRDCRLQSVTEDRSAVRYDRHSLDREEIRAHLTSGKLPTLLALTFDERVSFILTEQMEIKRVQFLDIVKEQISSHHDDAAPLFDAEFAVMTGELQRLLPAIQDAMGGALQRTGEAA